MIDIIFAPLCSKIVNGSFCRRGGWRKGVPGASTHGRPRHGNRLRMTRVLDVEKMRIYRKRDNLDLLRCRAQTPTLRAAHEL